MEKTFIRNITILYAFYSKSANFTDFEKKLRFFSENLSIFQKKPQFLNVSRILISPVEFFGKFATIWSKNNFTLGRGQNC